MLAVLLRMLCLLEQQCHLEQVVSIKVAAQTVRCAWLLLHLRTCQAYMHALHQLVAVLPSYCGIDLA